MAAGGDGGGPGAPRWFSEDVARIGLRILLWAYLAELLLNRILIRIIVFIPYNRYTAFMANVFNYGGRFALNLTVVLGLFLAVYLAFRSMESAVVAAVLVALTVLDYAGVTRIYWVLLLVAALVVVHRPRRVIEAAALVLLVATSLSTSMWLQFALQAAWLAAPLPLLSRRRIDTLTWSLPIAGLLAGLAYSHTYTMGQVLIFGMGLLSPWFLPPAVVLYPLSEFSWGRYGLLLTGPRLQLSNQVMALTALYMGDLYLGGARR